MVQSPGTVVLPGTWEHHVFGGFLLHHAYRFLFCARITGAANELSLGEGCMNEDEELLGSIAGPE